MNADAFEPGSGSVIPAKSETTEDLAAPKKFPDVSEKPVPTSGNMK